MAECAKGVYRPHRPRETAFYCLVEEHYERFEQVYPERYEDRRPRSPCGVPAYGAVRAR